MCVTGGFGAGVFGLKGFLSPLPCDDVERSERHAGAEAMGVSDALEFHYPWCHTNKCPLPGPIRAVPRFH